MADGLNIFCFHLDEQQPPNRQVHTILPAMVLSETPLSYHSTLTAELNFVVSDILENHLQILANFVYTIINVNHGEEEATKHYQQLIKIHKLRQKKFKTRNEMNALLIGRKIIKDEAHYVKTYMQWRQVSSELHRLIPFYRKGYFQVIEHIDTSHTRKHDAAADEKTIKAFTGGILRTDSEADMLLCMENTVQHMEWKDMTEGKPPFIPQGFLKLPMLNLPGFLSFKASKFSLLRDELQPQSGNWWKSLSEILKSFKGIDYTAGNAELIQQNMFTLLKPAADELKKKTEQSIYLQQLANDEMGEYGSTMSLCVTSVRNLLHAYYNTQQVSEAVMQAVEDYFTSRNEADRVVCFLLHEVPDYPPFVRYTTADHEYLNNAWKEAMDER